MGIYSCSYDIALKSTHYTKYELFYTCININFKSLY